MNEQHREQALEALHNSADKARARVSRYSMAERLELEKRGREEIAKGGLEELKKALSELFDEIQKERKGSSVRVSADPSTDEEDEGPLG